MTTAVLINNKAGRYSPVLHNFKENVRSNSKLLIMFGVLHLFAAPMVMLAMIISIYTGHRLESATAYLIIGILTTALAGFMGIFPAVNSFSELNDKTVVDMRFSLPLNATQRFISNFLAGLFVYIVPFLGAQVLSLLLGCYGLIFMDGKTFEHIYGVGEDMRSVYTCEYFSEVMPMLLKLIFAGLLCMLMLYTLTVLITVCCGSKFESIAYTILVNVAIPVTIICVFYSMLENLYGVDASDPVLNIISYTSAAGGILAALDWVIPGEITNGAINHGVWALVFFLLTVAYGVLAYFLYQKRRAPQTSRPFAFKLAYYIVVTCIEFCIISAMLDAGYLLPCIIITAIAYLIFEVVTNRGFKKIWKSGIKYVCTFIAAAGIIVLSEATDGFGTVWRVPSAGSVKSAEIEYSGYYGFFPTDETVTLTDPESIGLVIDVQKKILDDYRNNPSENDYSGYLDGRFTVRYNLRGGRSFEREYHYIFSPKIAEAISRIDLTEEYKAGIAELYGEEIMYYYGLIRDNMENISQFDFPDDKMYVSVSSQVYNDQDFQLPVSAVINRNFFEQFSEAYQKDIMSITEENYYRSDCKNIWYVHLVYNTFTVPETFTNTLELLRVFGFELNRIEDATDEELRRTIGGKTILVRTSELRERINYPADMPVHGNVMSANWVNWHAMLSDMDYFVYGKSDELFTLVRNAEPMNIAEDNGYIIYVYGHSGAIPADLTGIADGIVRTSYNSALEEQYNYIAYGESTDSYE